MASSKYRSRPFHSSHNQLSDERSCMYVLELYTLVFMFHNFLPELHADYSSRPQIPYHIKSPHPTGWQATPLV